MTYDFKAKLAFEIWENKFEKKKRGGKTKKIKNLGI
jgi:hypothetical protein